jgi:hypothetical protein
LEFSAECRRFASNVEPLGENSLNPSDVRDLKSALIIKRGKYDGGTWGHPDIAIQFAQWLDKSFALQVSRWVREWMTTGRNPVQSQPAPISDDIKAALNQLEQSIISIRSQARAVHTCAHQPLKLMPLYLFIIEILLIASLLLNL